jgi:hypothetical protein
MGQLDKFDIVVYCRNGKFVAGVPQLYLYAKGDDVQSVMAALEKKKQDVEADLTPAELDEMTVKSVGITGSAAPAAQSGGLKMFAAKFGIVVGVLAVATMITVPIVANRIDKSAQQFRQVGGRAFWANVERSLEEMADPKNDIPREKAERIAAQIRKISARFQPFVFEAKQIFADPPAAAKP